MKKFGTYTYTEACEDFALPKCPSMQEVMTLLLQCWNPSHTLLSLIVRSQPLKPKNRSCFCQEVQGTLGQFTFSSEECLWEKSCKILNLFRENA